MAKKSSLPFVVNGYAQVEANRLTYMINGEMESQAPAYDPAEADRKMKLIENGMFLCLMADGAGISPMGRIAVLPGGMMASDEPWMVYSEKKLYDEREGYVDWAADANKSVDGWIYPRLVKLHPGDVYTTNCINEASVAVGTSLYIGDDGYLSATKGTNEVFMFVVDKVYTMPDGEPGVKLHVENFR